MLCVNIGALVFVDLISREDDSDVTSVFNSESHHYKIGIRLAFCSQAIFLKHLSQNCFFPCVVFPPFLWHKLVCILHGCLFLNIINSYLSAVKCCMLSHK